MHRTRPDEARSRDRDRAVIALAALNCMLALAACGSSSESGSAGRSSTYVQGVRYADCMRSHGVPNFPDPAVGGGFPLRTSGIDMGAPAYLSTYQACLKLLPGGTARPAISAAQQAGMIAKARCVREHGVPNFPDRGQTASGPYNSVAGIEIPTSINLQSPAYQSATKSCQGLLSAVFSHLTRHP